MKEKSRRNKMCPQTASKLEIVILGRQDRGGGYVDVLGMTDRKFKRWEKIALPGPVLFNFIANMKLEGFGNLTCVFVDGGGVKLMIYSHEKKEWYECAHIPTGSTVSNPIVVGHHIVLTDICGNLFTYTVGKNTWTITNKSESPYGRGNQTGAYARVGDCSYVEITGLGGVVVLGAADGKSVEVKSTLPGGPHLSEYGATLSVLNERLYLFHPRGIAKYDVARRDQEEWSEVCGDVEDVYCAMSFGNEIIAVGLCDDIYSITGDSVATHIGKWSYSFHITQIEAVL